MTEKRTGPPVDSRTRRLVVGLAAAVLLALLAGVVGAQTSGSYDLSWYTFDGGHGVLAGTHYGMAGTLGESLAGWATGAHYGMAGGYDPGVQARVYLPIVLRAYN